MKIDKSKIKFVDGFKIRNTLDDDFTVLHSRSLLINDFAPKFFVPEGEWWFDHSFKDEIDFFIEVEEKTDNFLSTMEFEEAREKLKEMIIYKDVKKIKKLYMTLKNRMFFL